MNRDCDQFREQLLDLAYGEVDEQLAGELREHAAGCAECRQELETLLLTRKLAAQLPTPEPVIEDDEMILALAVEKAADFAAAHPLSGRESSVEDDPILGRIAREPTLIDRLRGVLLKPALVTAAAASVVLVLALFLHQNATTPEQRQLDSVAGAPFHGPATPVGDAPAPSPPSAPLERPAGTTLARAETAPPSPRKDPSQPLRELAPAADLGTGNRGGGGGGYGRGIGTAGPAPRNPAEQLESEAPIAPEQSARAKSRATSGDLDVADQLAGAGLGTAAAEPSPTLPAAPAAPPAAATEESGVAGSYQAGKEAFDRGDCATASRSFERVIASSTAAPQRVASSLHHLARCEKRTGRCGKAVLLYQRLLDGYPAYGERPAAIWEAAGCHRRLGHLSQANALLEELAAIPGWRERARTEQRNLEQVETEER